MSDVSRSASARLPDLYALLGLEPLEPDRARIKQSLEGLASQIRARSQSPHKDASSQAQVARARKLFEFANQHLLDSARKAGYDQQWKTVYGTPAWDLSELQALLPQGDPSNPFQPAEYLADRTPEVAARYAEDYDKLLNLLAPQAAPQSSTAVDDAIVSSAVNPTVSSLPSNPDADQPTKVSLSTDTPLARRLRNKRGPSLLWQATSVLVAVAIVLGIVVWRLQPANEQLATPSPRELPPAQAGASAAVSEPAARRSGLPSIPGIDAVMSASQASEEDYSTGPGGAPADANSAPDNSAVAGIAMRPTEMPDEPAPKTASAAETSPLSDAERQQWTEGMLAARGSIGRQQFAQLTGQLESLRGLARTRLQTQQLARLATTGQLVERFRQSLDQALEGMGAAESFSFGNGNLASFVEADGTKIILRIEGTNQTFAITELPVELAFAIVDMVMDREHPQSLAAKAAFMLVHPVARDMQQAWQDDFQSP